MVGRGVMLTYSLTTPDNLSRISDALHSHPNWEERTSTVILGKTNYGPYIEAMEPNVYGYAIQNFNVGYDPVALFPGEYGVTAPKYWLDSPAFSKEDASAAFHNNWSQFEENSNPYLIGVTQSRRQQLLFGGWLPGSTLSLFEFPVQNIYYRPIEGDWMEKDKYYSYAELRNAKGTEAYFEAFSRIDNAMMLGVIAESEYDPVDPQGSLECALITEDGAENNAAAEKFVVLGFGTDGQVLFAEWAADGTLDLTDSMGAACEVEYKDARYVLKIDGRKYVSQGAAGFVYDLDLERLLDWPLQK